MVGLSSTPALGHGTLGSLKMETGWLVSAFYDDGEPMAYTEVLVFHNEESMPFQTGRTDKNGNFMFFPDTPGMWKTTITDEMGHGLTLKTQIDNPLAPKESEIPKGASGTKTSRAFAGLSMIFFLSGLGFWWTGRKVRNESIA